MLLKMAYLSETRKMQKIKCKIASNQGLTGLGKIVFVSDILKTKVDLKAN